jgi:hypothetical protein
MFEDDLGLEMVVVVVVKKDSISIAASCGA